MKERELTIVSTVYQQVDDNNLQANFVRTAFSVRLSSTKNYKISAQNEDS